MRYLLAVMLVLGGLGFAKSVDAKNAEQAVDTYFGAYSTSIPIAVPPHHGIEPKISLSYRSSSQNSLLGVGMALDATYSIERGSPRAGAPRYDARDVFFLNGQELMPCTSQGGTHCTVLQNYSRIRYHPDLDQWTVTGTSGNHMIFTPGIQHHDGTFRWLLTKVVDTKGNEVTYQYSCVANGRCVLDDITYNRSRVRFFYEPRDDVYLEADGVGQVAVDQRLQLVLVETLGEAVRAYALSYRYSAATYRSLLQSVTQYGRDVTVDEHGSIKAGSFLPPMRFEWSDAVEERQLTFAASLPGASLATHSHLTPRDRRVLSGDFNGDGRTDLWHLHPSRDASQSWVALSHGDGTFEFQTSLPGSDRSTNSYLDPTVANLKSGDFNGDGLGDILYMHPGPADRSWVALSNGDGTFDFRQALPAATKENNAFLDRESQIVVGDFNGDGASDLLQLAPDPDPSKSWVAISNRDGTFTFSASLPGASIATHSYLTTVNRSIRTGDFNGDSYTDLLHLHDDANAGKSWVALSNGDGTFEFMTTLPGSAESAHSYYHRQHSSVVMGDFNGDGKTDMLSMYPNADSKRSWVALSNGDGSFDFAARLPGSSVETNTYLSVNHRDVHSGDFNGDGLTDVLHLHPHRDPRYSWVGYARGDGTFDFVRDLPGASVATHSYLDSYRDLVLGDFNGDGKHDLAHLHSHAHSQYSFTAMSSGTFTDLVHTIHNGIGGSTKIEYAPSTRWQNQYLPAGFVIPTVVSSTLSDGRGNDSTSTYSYAGALWSSAAYRFLGFGKVTTILDAKGNYSEVEYLQNERTIAKPHATYFRDNEGRLFSYTKYQYQDSREKPYSSLLTDRWDFECNLTEKCRRNLVQMAYDVYGNVVATYEHGDIDVAGDERTTVRGYVPNQQQYIVGLPEYESTYEGIGIEGRLIKQIRWDYDGQLGTALAPKMGNITGVRKWDGAKGVYVGTKSSFDLFGNIIEQIDERGNAAHTVFDHQARRFPVEICNGLGHCTRRTWDKVMGLEVTRTDANGAVIHLEYDVFGRKTTESFPQKGATSYEYRHLGDPKRQVQMEIVRDGSPQGLWTKAFIDGLGRTYRKEKKGGLVQEFGFIGASKRLFKKSHWYGPDEEPQWTYYAYDGAQRLRRETLPDGYQSEVVYSNDHAGKPYQLHIDEAGKHRIVWKDSYGQVIQVAEQQGEGLLYTSYEYDRAGNLIHTVDAEEHHSFYEWDTLGRKTAGRDSDMGTWKYEYDAAGQLIKQTDALGQVSTFAYDVLGRKIRQSTGQDVDTVWTYDDAAYGSATGRLVRETFHGGSIEHYWDERGLETKTRRCVDGECVAFRRTFDVMGRLKLLTYPDGEPVRYRYDRNGRLFAVGRYLVATKYNARGQITELDYLNGTRSHFSYDPARLWLDRAEVLGPTGSLGDLTYRYDPKAQVSAMSSSSHQRWNVAYRYDDIGRLLQVDGPHRERFAYDGVGRFYFHSGAGIPRYDDSSHPYAMTRAGNRRLSYDANGYLVNSTDPDRGEQRFVWDPQGRLLSWHSGSQQFDYRYEPGGSRILVRRVQNGVPVETTRYFGPLYSKGVQVRKNYYAGQILIATDVDGDLKWFHSDHLGSTRWTTKLDGTTDESFAYTAFGQRLNTATEARGYAGHRLDEASGLVYMQARYYDPSLGIFISPDTMTPDPLSSQAFHRYSYVYNNPISNTDPSGHAPVVAAVATAVMVGGSAAATWVTATAFLAAGVTTLGYFTKNTDLLTLGGILMGFATGGAMGQSFFQASMAFALSPRSPLDPGLQRALGWAYTAYGLIMKSTQSQLPKPNPEAGKYLRRAAQEMLDGQGISEATRTGLAKATGIRVDRWQSFFDRYTDLRQVAALRDSTGILPTSRHVAGGFWGSPIQLRYGEIVSERLGQVGFAINKWEAILLNPTGGITGAGSMGIHFQTGAVALHSVYHDAHGFLNTAFGLGGGYAQFPHPGLFPGSPLSGQVGGMLLRTLQMTGGHLPSF